MNFGIGAAPQRNEISSLLTQSKMAILTNQASEAPLYDTCVDGIPFIFCDKGASVAHKLALVADYQVVCVGFSRRILMLGNPTMS